jgi:hypothetical protein
MTPVTGSIWVSGDIAESKQALDNAIRVDPTTPDVVWQAANFDLV